MPFEREFRLAQHATIHVTNAIFIWIRNLVFVNQFLCFFISIFVCRVEAWTTFGFGLTKAIFTSSSSYSSPFIASFLNVQVDESCVCVCV